MAVILWHRRDLRLHDNAALYHAWQRDPQVIPVFILDPQILGREDTGPGRVQFLLDCLRVLDHHYQQRGSRLVIRRGDPALVLAQLLAASGAREVVWNQDVEPFAIERDRRVMHHLGAGICRSFQDMLLHGPEEIVTQGGQPYSVYGPFWRNWISQPKGDPYPTPDRFVAHEIGSEPLPSLADLGMRCDQVLPAAGELEALALLEGFCRGAIWDYDEQRHFPAVEGTSRLSPHLRFGTLGIRYLWRRTCDLEATIRSQEGARNLLSWRQEIAWREFYKHALAHWPHLETQPFRQKFARLVWDNDSELFQAWCAGETGYPIVDAAMRQLNQTGWMHNRCRMIVASFLTKDLLIDWRWGERYFMQKLVDGDLAANNGGWQWSASVGTDPRPLRIFNPTTQALNYDPEAVYIRRYVPELAKLDPEEILNPKGLSPLQRRACGYVPPIVDHKKQQQEFKRRYQACHD
ncbi:MAG: deoxyribodipyrimidine photo-lyase [Thermostichales cyanobacterium SZTDM-1c_bins_54]